MLLFATVNYSTLRALQSIPSAAFPWREAPIEVVLGSVKNFSLASEVWSMDKILVELSTHQVPLKNYSKTGKRKAFFFIFNVVLCANF